MTFGAGGPHGRDNDGRDENDNGDDPGGVDEDAATGDENDDAYDNVEAYEGDADDETTEVAYFHDDDQDDANDDKHAVTGGGGAGSGGGGAGISGAGDDDRDERENVVVCHMPPGNPNRRRTITVGETALEAHIAHGDQLGECDEDEDDPGEDDSDDDIPDEELRICESVLVDGTVEFSDFPNPKRVGVDTLVAGLDTVVIGFDFTQDGDSIVAGTIINSLFQGVGVRLAAVLTNGPHVGDVADTEALDTGEAPNLLSQVGISPPNILSAVDPDLGPQYSGRVSGLATLIVTFVTPSGEPAKVSQVGAFNDLIFGNNTLTAYAGPDASGRVLGTSSASGRGDFFGFGSSAGIASVTFSGYSTEIDDLVFTPVFVDCNDNGVPDQCDVASDTSQDDNGNGVPDECDGSDADDADSDNDGVMDDADACADTPTGDNVSADGCTVVTLAAVPGPDVDVLLGDAVNVVGQGSVLTGNYDEANLVYAWAQSGGDTVSFSFSGSTLTVYTSGASGDLTFTLTVSTADGSVLASDAFTISIACSVFIATIEPSNGEAATYATAVNGVGQVVGWYGRTAGPFLWQDGLITDLGTLGGTWGFGYSINDAGDVSMKSKMPTGPNHAAIWSDGTLYDMQLPGQCGGCNGDMRDTNEAGVSGGWSEWTSPIHSLQATLWYPDGTHDFVTPAGYRNALVQAVGETGDILLAASTGDPYKLGSESDGFLLSADGTLTNLGKLGTHPYLRPSAMSGGKIVGRAHGSGADNGFLWQNGVLTDLGTFIPTDINVVGDVVGSVNGVAHLMRNSVVTDLNSFLPSGTGWVLTAANGINDSGRVVGSGTIGGLTRGFVMDLCD